MKIPHLAFVAAVFCGLILISVPRSSRAGTNMISTNVVGGNTGWFSANVWKTNDGFGNPTGNFGTGHPSAGNTYKLIQGPNPAIGNNTAGTRTRNLYTNGTPVSLWTFPGDSLELTTNTEIRFKQIVTPATIETVNFPGVGGNPGLILNGGTLNVGDAIVQPVAGIIQAAPGSQSYLCPGNNDGGSVDSARALNILGQLTGSGTLVIFEGGTNNAQRISGNSNTFSGQWIVKAGWLLGAGTNSLGTNSITMDPNYVLPVPPFSSTAPVTEATGPAVLEVNYNLTGAGVLTLTSGGNGAIMRLHNNCAFSSVVIDGTPLSAGTHYWVELNADHPNNFPPGGEGAITVQPYGNPLPLLVPSIVRQPGPQLLFAGRNAHFTVSAIANTYPSLTYQWRKGGLPLSDGGNISGTTNATLFITGVSVADVASYDVVVSNPNGPVPSASASLTIVPLSGEPYEGAVAAAAPYAFYELNEPGDPATNNSPVYDYAGGNNGTYGISVQNGNANYNVAGPTATAGYPGFASGNKAAQTANAVATARISVEPLNLNTNTVTITAWINPSGPQNPFNGIFFCRGGGTVAGLNYAGYTDINGNSTLGYYWNGQFETYTWNSGLAAPPGQWSFVALVVTPSNATIHVMNTNGLASASQNFTHVVQSFSGTTLIGDDSSGADGARVFNGTIDDVAVFNRALSRTELITLYTNASGTATYAPIIVAQPANQSLYPGQTAQFTIGGGGTDPLTYQWKSGPAGGPYVNVADGGRISGATTPTLTIANVIAGDAMDYWVTISNPSGSTNSSVATLTVQTAGPAENITMTVQQAAGNNWETGVDWSDGQPASVSAFAKPGSTYTLLNGARMRTPEGPTVTNFPGDLLTLNGNAVWANSPAATVPISEVRFKQATAGTINGRVNFKRLVMNGGQLDAGNDGLLLLGGRIDVLTNAPLYNDGGNDRGYYIDAWLTGAGSIEYHGYTGASFQSGYRNPLNIAGTSNTFSGKWNIVQGVLLGSAPNCLGTNDIIVGTLGALETLYDVNNTNGNLILSGKMFLHQNDTFRTVNVAGVALNQGTYTYAQLAAAYPTNFPATWTMQNGSTVSNASGNITVLAQAGPAIVTQPVASQSWYPSETAQFSVSAVGFQPLSYRWRKNGVNMIDGTTTWGSIISGAATTNLIIGNVTNNDGADYTVVITNSIGSITSSVATLTIKPTFPAENITLNFGGAPIIQLNNPVQNWNTLDHWSDGLAASESALQKPGSTYEVVPGARLRTPAGVAFTNFPGNVLTVSGDGIWLENSTTAGEIRFKHANPGTVYFKKLVLNGGMLDSGDDGVTVLQGELHINDNTTNSFYADAAAGQDRPFQIDSWLTGGGMIEYHAFGTTFAGDVNVTGTSNTFHGIWHIVQGAVLGSAPNSLGTNDIIVETSGALETSYNLNNPNGSLILNGQMFLHQNDTFRAVNVAGTDLVPGTYSFATLNSTYTANFPATWPLQIGSAVNTGSGSITVLGDVVPRPTMQFQFSGGTLTLTWNGSFWLVEANEVTGPWVTNAAATSPFPVTPIGPRKFYGLQPK